MKTPAVFLDRDGTIIQLVHHLVDPTDVELIDGAGAAIAALKAAGYLIVVVTNQSVIGRGMLTEEGLEDVHAAMRAQLDAYDAVIDATYFCPVVPQQKDPSVIEDEMRKPGPGMLLRAAKEHGIDLASSWMVGDTLGDIFAGKNAGCRTILVKTGYGAKVASGVEVADKVVTDLSAAAEIILTEGPS